MMIENSDPGGSCRPSQLQNTNDNKRAQSVYFSRSIVILPNFALKGICMQPLLWNVNTAPKGHRVFLKNTSPIPPWLRPLIMPHSSKPICLCQVCAAGQISSGMTVKPESRLNEPVFQQTDGVCTIFLLCSLKQIFEITILLLTQPDTTPTINAACVI